MCRIADMPDEPGVGLNLELISEAQYVCPHERVQQLVVREHLSVQEVEANGAVMQIVQVPTIWEHPY
ncbi:Uncharacterised protein [Mycobacteroides abscessus subsp. massiliense]|nr:Uncharacterised protein [Mycobacteroides abscessus subsp. massiliense]